MNEAQFTAREKRRFTLEAKADAAMAKREKAAEAMIGQLCRDGKVVYYAWPVGGEYIENVCEFAVIQQILKKNYV